MKKQKRSQVQMCEVCGGRPGEMNSLYSFDNPRSSHDCGDWVCWQCEQELMTDAFDLAEDGYYANMSDEEKQS